MAYCVTFARDSRRFLDDGYTPEQAVEAMMELYDIDGVHIGQVYDVCLWMAYSDEIVVVELDRENERWEHEREWCVEYRVLLMDEGVSETDRLWDLVIWSTLPDFSDADLGPEELEVLTDICKRYFRDYPW